MTFTQWGWSYRRNKATVKGKGQRAEATLQRIRRNSKNQLLFAVTKFGKTTGRSISGVVEIEASRGSRIEASWWGSRNRRIELVEG